MTPSASVLNLWRHEPWTMAEDLWPKNLEPFEPWQLRFLKNYADPSKPRVGSKACVGPGKSFIDNIIGWHFLLTMFDPGEHPNGLALSCTADNLRDGLWKEFYKWYNLSPLLQNQFVIDSNRIYHRKFPKDWFISARNVSQKANKETVGQVLSGLHGKYILYLIDEGGQILSQVLRSAEQGLSTRPKFGKIVLTGNPMQLESALYEACVSQADKWNMENVTNDPDDPHRSRRADLEWAKEQIKAFGRDNPWVRFAIFGEFPPASVNALLGPADVERAMKRVIERDKYSWAEKRLGVDVARFGDDRTVLFPRQGLASFRPLIMRGARTNEIADKILYTRQNWAWDKVFIDDTGGWGAGVIDKLLADGETPIGANSSSMADSPRFFDKRAEMYWRMAEWIKRGGALPNMPELLKELVLPTYTYDKGKLRVEEKKFIKKRTEGHTSPDLADALALTFYQVDMPKNLSRKHQARARVDDDVKTLDGGRVLTDDEDYESNFPEPKYRRAA